MSSTTAGKLCLITLFNSCHQRQPIATIQQSSTMKRLQHYLAWSWRSKSLKVWKALSINNENDALHKTSNDASLARGDSADSAKHPPPHPLDVTRSVRNKVPISPMPIYPQQLLSGPLPSPFPNNNDSDDCSEDASDITQTLQFLKRKCLQEKIRHQHAPTNIGFKDRPEN